MANVHLNVFGRGTARAWLDGATLHVAATPGTDVLRQIVTTCDQGNNRTYNYYATEPVEVEFPNHISCKDIYVEVHFGDEICVTNTVTFSGVHNADGPDSEAVEAGCGIVQASQSPWEARICSTSLYPVQYRIDAAVPAGWKFVRWNLSLERVYYDGEIEISSYDSPSITLTFGLGGWFRSPQRGFLTATFVKEGAGVPVFVDISMTGSKEIQGVGSVTTADGLLPADTPFSLTASRGALPWVFYRWFVRFSDGSLPGSPIYDYPRGYPYKQFNNGDTPVNAVKRTGALFHYYPSVDKSRTPLRAYADYMLAHRVVVKVQFPGKSPGDVPASCVLGAIDMQFKDYFTTTAYIQGKFCGGDLYGVSYWFPMYTSELSADPNDNGAANSRVHSHAESVAAKLSGSLSNQVDGSISIESVIVNGGAFEFACSGRTFSVSTPESLRIPFYSSGLRRSGATWYKAPDPYDGLGYDCTTEILIKLKGPIGNTGLLLYGSDDNLLFGSGGHLLFDGVLIPPCEQMK